MAQNYLLPKTEQSINRLLHDMQMLVQSLQIALYSVFFIYSAYRISFQHSSPVINGIYLFITAVSIGFCIAELARSSSISPALYTALKLSRRLVRLCILIDALWTIFTQVQGYRVSGTVLGVDTGISIIYAIFSIILYVLLLVGDSVSALCQRYITDILHSFTEDIQIDGLKSRGISHLQQETRKKLNNIIPGLRED